jgi:polyisoprenoid-binding protein YceI
MRAWRRRHPAAAWIVAGVISLGVIAVLGPVAFFRLEGNAPGRLRLPVASGVVTGPAAPGPVSGTWVVTTGSQAGYRVKEILFGQHHTAVGRTSKVTGGVVISGTELDAADFTVDMGSVVSDQEGRNVQFNDYILDTGAHPHGTFHLTKAVDLGDIPVPGKVVTETATGALNLRGVTQVVTFSLQAERVGDAIDVNAEIPIVYSRWHIPNPSFGITSVGKTGTIEVLLHLIRA